MAAIKPLPPVVSEVFYLFNVGAPVEIELLASCFRQILEEPDDQPRDVLLGALLTGVMVRGPSIEEIVALLRTAFALDGYDPTQRPAVTLPKGARLVGCAGSGKKGVKTINVSTPCALIAASAGAYVAKPGSFSTSSVTGSAEFMRDLGVDIEISTDAMVEVLQRTGFGFFPIERVVPRFNSRYAGRFHAPHVLSFGLAALLCPVKTDRLLYGLAHPRVDLSIRVLRAFGLENAIVVSCAHDDIHFVDEIGVYGSTKLVGMQNGSIGHVIHFRPTEELGRPRYHPADIAQADTAGENVRYGLDVLAGRGKPAHEDVICINAANVLFLSGRVEDLKEGFHLAKSAVSRGLALQKLEEVIDATKGDRRTLAQAMG